MWHTKAKSLLLKSARRGSPGIRGISNIRQTECGLHIDESLPRNFNKILIANRGEIACRVIRTARALGVKTVAVFSEADKNAQHVLLADEAIHIGNPPAAESYLIGDKILAAAKQTGAEAIHPGYGFLSENAQFADACIAAGVKFIGPPSGAIHAMGSKSASKNIMIDAKVPVVPGYHGEEQNVEKLQAEAKKIGYPLMIKAVLGGGGKGMRIVRSEEEFLSMLDAAKRESMKSFADDNVLLERYIERPRHIEFQVFADQFGNALHLYERDCSVQRRHQKVLEEAPAPGMTEELRKQMGDSAVNAAKAVGYEGAGTVEFIFDAATNDYFFMEMNTRLQVEHPVSEMICKRDLVQWQLHVAKGHPLPATQDEVNKNVSGHALEARIYAEDPDNGFLPAIGTLHHVSYPTARPDIRVETGITAGDEVSIFYDPMIAKLVVWAADRETALQKCDDALSKYEIVGCPTNISFLKKCIQHPDFQQGEVETNFIEDNADTLLGSDESKPTDPVSAAFVAMGMLGDMADQSEARAKEAKDSTSPWTSSSGFRINSKPVLKVGLVEKLPGQEEGRGVDVVAQAQEDGSYAVSMDGAPALAVVPMGAQGREMSILVDNQMHRATVVPEGREVHIFRGGARECFELPQAQFGASELAAGDGCVAPMAGKVVKMLTEVGAEFKKGDQLVILEAMKMEHVVRAPRDGLVKDVLVGDGDFVEGKKLLVSFELQE